MAKRRVNKAAPGKSPRGRRFSKPPPNGSYAWNGKAIPFGKLPKAERARHRSRWATVAAKTRATTRKATATKHDARLAKDWIKRRTAWAPKHGTASQIAGMVPASKIDLSPEVILALRERQRAAHRAYMVQGHGGGAALRIAEQTMEALGPELAAMMPQLWWYH